MNSRDENKHIGERQRAKRQKGKRAIVQTIGNVVCQRTHCLQQLGRSAKALAILTSVFVIVSHDGVDDRVNGNRRKKVEDEPPAARPCVPLCGPVMRVGLSLFELFRLFAMIRPSSVCWAPTTKLTHRLFEV